MNTMRWLAAAMIVGFLGTLASADEKKNDYAKKIVGKWECTKADEGSLPLGTLVEFTKDGKLIVSFKAGDQDMKLEGTYKLDGDKFDINLKSGDQEHKDTITIKKLDDTTLATTGQDGKTVELTRKKK